MNRRHFLSTLVAGTTSCVFRPGKLSPHAKETKPNFVFFLIDDLGWADLGCYGSSFYETPNVDRFAKTAMRFTDAYAACPVCSPTRASIMTGKYPAALGITDWIPGARKKGMQLIGPQIKNELPLGEVTVAEALKDAGYSTFFAGKWHLGGKGYYPEQQGFDINIGGCAKGSPGKGGYFSPYKNPKLVDGPAGEFLTDRLADESIKFIESRKNKSNPFLLYLSFYTVHTPLQGKESKIEKYRKKAAALGHRRGPQTVPVGHYDAISRRFQDLPVYAAMVESMDENVGRVLDRLDQLGMAETTVIFFMSDNGGLCAMPGNRSKTGGPTSNAPLRAGKGWLYEGGIREPMMVRWPGVTRPDTTCDVPLTSTDFYPTMLDIAGLPARPNQHRDGVSFVPLLKGGDSIDRDALYWHYPHYHGSGSRPSGAIRSGDYKLIEFFETGQVELYNLRQDIGETNDLSRQMPDKTAEMLDRLRKWRHSIGAKMPTPNPKYKPSRSL